MKQIQANARSIEALLSQQTYQIDYYQREYRWEEKQVEELLDDLVNSFLDDYETGHSTEDVKTYGNYFLGPIIVSQRGADSFIVDGQQRLTTITLLLIYLEQKRVELGRGPNLSNLIYYDDYGTETFNLKVPEREPALRSLLKGEIPDTTGNSESVANLVERFQNISEHFPFEGNEKSSSNGSRQLSRESFIHFLYWITTKVFLVEIVASSDEDAYTIFETMNDRGLSLTPTDMLKGYLLANITDDSKRIHANDVWREMVAELNTDEREGSSDFIKAWLRSQYAQTIRTSQGKVQDFDFDRIGSEFHRWVRDQAKPLNLKTSNDFYYFIVKHMRFFADQYQLIQQASTQTVPGLEHVRYNAHRGFTLQPMFLLATVRLGDSPEIIRQKLRLGALYLDILLGWKDWNYRRIGQSSMKNSIFNDLKAVRDKINPANQALALHDLLTRDQDTIDSNDRFTMTKMNGRTIHRVLARLTEYVEKESGKTLSWETLVSDKIKNRYQIEHIWANKFDRHRDEFSHQADFWAHRDRLGDLVLIPSDINQSFRDRPFEDKIPHYSKQNMLTASLSERAYEYEPGFLGFVRRSGLSFRPYREFKRSDVEERQELYGEIAKRIWNPQLLLDEVQK